MHTSKIKTKIVCTIGPATWDANVLQQLIDNGMTVARINASFADAVEIKRVTKLIRDLSDKVAVLLDLKGHKIRVSDFGDPIDLHPGEEFILDTDPSSKYVSVSYENLHKDIKVGSPILIDDGKIKLQVKEIRGTQIVCDVKNKGELKRLKTVNVPGTYLSFDPLTEKDKIDIQAGVESEVDLIAGSFVRDAKDVEAIQERIDGSNIGIIAKIEDPLGVQNFDEILKEVYGIMIARGDLGVEIPYEQVPILQKEFIKKCNAVGKPVIVATHMLESMTNNPSPTRAEVSDVANAIFDWTDAIMTSAETSTGSYPVEAIVTMNNIARNIEKLTRHDTRMPNVEEILEYNGIHSDNSEGARSAIGIAKAASELCSFMPIKGVFVVSKEGFTVRMLSKFRVKPNIHALVRDLRSEKKLALSQGVYAYHFDSDFNSKDELISKVVKFADENKLALSGELISIIVGSLEFKGQKSSILEVTQIP